MFYFIWLIVIGSTTMVHAAEKINVGDAAPIKRLLKLSFEGVKDAALLENIKNNAELYQRLSASSDSPKKKSELALSEAESQRLLAMLPQQVKTAAKPFGYYQAQVSTSDLTGSGDTVIVNINLGPPVLVESLIIQIDGEASSEPRLIGWQKKYPLAAGNILNQHSYDTAKKDLSRIGRQLGYFDAEFTSHSIEISADKRKADVHLVYASGERYRLGDISIVWENLVEQEPIDEDLINTYISIKKGDLFNEELLLKLQRSMTAGILVETVAVTPLIETRANRQVPVEIRLSLAERHAYGASAGFGTDTGPRATLNYENRRLNRAGHRFNSSFYISGEKQNILANYRIPLSGTISDSLNLILSQTQEDSDARDLSTSIARIDVARSNDNHQWNYGVSYRDERFREGLVETQSNLLVPSISWQVIDADNAYSPNKGWKLSTTFRGAHADLASDLSFLQLIVNAKAVYPAWRGRLLARSQFAASLVEGSASLPESLRFFAGGDHSIRGYAYQSIGISNKLGDLQGGENMAIASLEYEHRLKGATALAVFIDAGDAFDDKLNLKKGIGVGYRYRLPFGAFRLDIASALDLPDRPLRLHLTFGTDL